MSRVLFLCTGNFYRSRFAEALFNHFAAAEGLPYTAASRGLAIHLVTGDLSPLVVEELRRRAICRTRTGAVPAALTEADLAGAARVIALSGSEHRPLLVAQFPGWADRVDYWDVPDAPDLGPAEAFLRIEEGVRALIRALS